MDTDDHLIDSIEEDLYPPPLEETRESDLTADAETLKRALRTDRMSNPALRESLGWDQDRYRRARDYLEDQNLIVRGRGRGGTVRLADVELTTPTRSTQHGDVDLRSEYEAEAELYEPLRRSLEQGWAPERRLDQYLVRITAAQGRRNTGGKWTRPDLVVVGQSGFRYVPGNQFDVFSFEVKPKGALDITVVYEALSHLRTATHSYVMLHADPDTAQDAIDDISKECARHGLSLIVFAAPDDFSSWDEMVSPVRREPDKHGLDNFLHTQLDDETRGRVQRWK